MKTYELSYIVSPEVTGEEAETKAKEIESAIQSKEGVILKQSNPIAKTLAFPIGRRASGFLGVLEFQLEPERLIELQETIRKDGKIVRHMVIIKEIAKPQKIRRARIITPEVVVGQKIETENDVKEESAPAKSSGATKEKVELKDIEEKLEELLG